MLRIQVEDGSDFACSGSACLVPARSDVLPGSCAEVLAHQSLLQFLRRAVLERPCGDPSYS